MSSLEEVKHLKRYIFRTLHVLSSQIELIRIISYVAQPTHDYLIERLTVPPIAKLRDFYKNIDGMDDCKHLKEVLKRLIENQVDLIVEMNDYLKDPEQDWSPYIREPVIILHGEYKNVFNEINKITGKKEKYSWLFEVPGNPL